MFIGESALKIQKNSVDVATDRMVTGIMKISREQNMLWRNGLHHWIEGIELNPEHIKPVLEHLPGRIGPRNTAENGTLGR